MVLAWPSWFVYSHALPPYLDSIDLRNARVLIADDVADTGATLAYVYEFCKNEVALNIQNIFLLNYFDTN